MNFIIQQNIS